MVFKMYIKKFIVFLRKTGTDRRTDRQTDGQTNKRIDRRTDRQTNRQKYYVKVFCIYLKNILHAF